MASNNLRTGEESWSLGVLIGLPIAAFFLLVGVAAVVAGLWWRWKTKRDERRSSFGYDDGMFVARSFWITGIVTVVFTVGITAGTMYPYSSEYHKWTEYEGTIASIDSRLMKEAEQRFVVSFAEDDLKLSCDDTRCATLKVGDTLTLSCKRKWQYTGKDGYDCNYQGSVSS